MQIPSVLQFTRKQIFIALCSGITIFFLFYVVTRSLQEPMQKPLSSMITPTTVSFSGTSQAFWHTYTSSYFSLSYPPDWQQISFAFPSGEDILFSPSLQKSRREGMNIIVDRASVRSLAEKTNILLQLGFKESPIVLNTLNTIQLQGSLSITSNTTTLKSYDQYIYAQRNGIGYTIHSFYTGVVPDISAQNLHAKILQTFHFVP